MHTSNRYYNVYSLNSDKNPVFDEMVSNDKTANSINAYSVVSLNSTLASTPTKLIKNKHKTRRRTQLTTINRAHSDTISSARFLPTALHSVSQAIIHAHTNKISFYNY